VIGRAAERLNPVLCPCDVSRMNAGFKSPELLIISIAIAFGIVLVIAIYTILKVF
jgi:hypothetical protein